LISISETYTKTLQATVWFLAAAIYKYRIHIKRKFYDAMGIYENFCD